jgi:AcrR family transcriptional regulator
VVSTREDMAPPKRRRERLTNNERTARTQAYILDACVDCLNRYGFGATTTHKVAEMAGLSRGAMSHHYQGKAHLMAAVIRYAYERQCERRIEVLDKIPEGMPRFLQLLDLAWETAQLPYGMAINEIRVASRSDEQLAAAITPITRSIAADYGRFLGHHVKAAGLTSDAALRGVTQTWTMALRALAMDRVTHPDQEFVESVLATLRGTRDAVVANQLAGATKGG